MIQGIGSEMMDERLDMDSDQIIRFFQNFNLRANVEYQPFPIQRFKTIIKAARSWHGKLFAQYVMDCFIPCGSDENCFGSCVDMPSHYEFDYPVELIPFKD